MHETQQYITLTEAAKLAPSRPSVNCVWRWCRKGVLSRGGQRIRLQHVRIGGKLYTTESWLRQFGQSLADADASYFQLDRKPAAPVPAGPARSDRQRQAAVERAERELAEMGV
ncbi:MAG: DUF1580 domain-containing protein [Planctomycetota bacterium]